MKHPCVDFLWCVSALSLLWVLCAPSLPAALPPEGASRWEENFSDPVAFAALWTPYGFLAKGVDAAHPLGTNVSGTNSRPEWWQLVDGALCAQNFPEEKHPAGITRPAVGSNVRVRCKVKLSKGGMAQFTIRGDNPIVERNFHIAVLRVHTDAVAAADNDLLHPKGSPEAEAMKSKGVWNRKFFVAKTEKHEVLPDVWHDLSIELKGRELTAFVDGVPALRYTTLCGDVAKTSLGLAGGRSGSEVMRTWFKDVRFEPLESSVPAAE
jgi:hypothetical protein